MAFPLLKPAVLAIAVRLAVSAAPVPDCASCHPREAAAHARTRHAVAMVPALESAFAANLPSQPLREPNGGYSISFHLVSNGIAVTAARGGDRADGLIEWVVGAGEQGQTPLVRAAAGVLESHVSYFPSLHRFGITVGQNPGASPNANAALGHLQSAHDLQNCLGCHTSAITRDLEPVVPGIQCLRCHIGAAEHAQGGSKPPLNPGKLSPAAQVRFCGNCHRSAPPGKPSDLENVRFQPYRLTLSRCFSSGKLACTTCHPAHQDAVRGDPSFYNAICRSCHAPPSIHAGARQSGDCTGCHMPRVQLHPGLAFHDHDIRVAASASASTFP